MEAIEAKIGYTFRQKGLLEEALTHPSCAKGYSNQRLEFLGDAVLGLVVAELLFRLFPQEKEGELARRQAALVCSGMLAEFVQEKGLAEHLQMTEGDIQTGGRENPSNLEDMAEAIIGAVYLDGGLEAVKHSFLPYWETKAKVAKEAPKDPKTGLQEWAQARGFSLPAYRVAETEGPAHAPVFTVEAAIEDGTVFSATATTKRAAEREAARLLLEHLEAKEN